MYLCALLETPMTINSNKEAIATTPEKLYNILISFIQNNQMPIIPQVSNWTKLEDGCSFTIMDMINCSMRLTGKTPYSEVMYAIGTDKNMSANAIFQIKEDGDQSELQISVEADVPLFMQMMVKSPLEQSLNKGVLKIKELAERI